MQRGGAPSEVGSWTLSQGKWGSMEWGGHKQAGVGLGEPRQGGMGVPGHAGMGSGLQAR